MLVLSFLAGIAKFLFGGIAIWAVFRLRSLRRSIGCGTEKLGAGFALVVSLVILMLLESKF
ncbi:hypothetical protein SAMN04489735_10782 [Aneurinibacillus thermoaerophilus]|uniref:Uncharacterized protein n=1 Tax=Aneurinibacillus thermoaerophilus TaxID=143495 RepID=A0A1G8FQS3_ANETH|nr:hypothetical protein ACH33_16860 [Aneurinibacillus sp. XH2]SDH84455.1 hypothetical protein SAMN04489735_10782 [Aneurinibacillus thermoaerophilus]